MKLRTLLSSLLAGVMFITGTLPAYAAVGDTGFADVAADAWYADAVGYVKDHALMSGTSDTTFSPDAGTSRAMLATILYRAEGSPAVTARAVFPDVATDAYYASAVAWAADNGIVSGYGSGLFGSDDAVTREQIAAILWRYAGSPSAPEADAFADQSTISAYAISAVSWARGNGVIAGKGGNRFDPAGTATRAEVATILRNYMTMQAGTPDTPNTAKKTLVVYFSVPETTSATNMTTEEDNSVVVIDGKVLGNTQYMAQVIAEATGADIFRIEPETAYPTDHTTLVAQASKEKEESARPALKTQIENFADYDTIFVGYPNWWGDMPMVLYSFFDAYDFAGKTIIPFNTHGGSGFSNTVATIQRLEPQAKMLQGLSISRSSIETAKSQIEAWVKGLEL